MKHLSDGDLHAYLDGALDGVARAEARAIRDHLDRCAACAERLAEEGAYRDRATAILAEADWPVEAVPFEDLRRRALVGERAASVPGRQGRVRRLAWAASVAVALGVGWVLRGEGTSRDGGVEVAVGTSADFGSPNGTVSGQASPEGSVSEQAPPEGSVAEHASFAAAAPGVVEGGERPDADVLTDRSLAVTVALGDGTESDVGQGETTPSEQVLHETTKVADSRSGSTRMDDLGIPALALDSGPVPADFGLMVAGPPHPPSVGPLSLTAQARTGREMAEGTITEGIRSLAYGRGEGDVDERCVAVFPEPVPDERVYPQTSFGRSAVPNRTPPARGHRFSVAPGTRAAGAAALALSAGTACQPTAVENAAATINEADHARRIGIIAHDSMGGRATPSPGLEKTAAWIAAEFEVMGLRGGAEDGGYIQRYPIERVRVVDEASAMVVGDARLEFGPDVVTWGVTASVEAIGGLLLVAGTEDAGAAAIEHGVEGQHVVFVAPAGTDNGMLSVNYRDMSAVIRQGAASASIAVGADALGSPWSDDPPRIRPVVRKGWGDVPPGRPPQLFVRAESLAEALSGTGIDLGSLAAHEGAAEAHSVPGTTATLSVRVEKEALTAPNVVGVLPGSDPALADEYLVYSAHMDHLGTGSPDANGDSIFNGADDNASGTAAVIEIAEAMATLGTPPARSVVFLLVSGEEYGLWGSEWFSENSTVPVDAMVANLNADMVGRNWTDTIVAIGKEHSDLGETLERVNAAHPELNMTAIDDIWPDERFYYRSDHFNFARRGVPVLFFFNGTHEDYHGLDDETDRVDSEKASRIAKLLFYLGLDVADSSQRPVWNPDSYASIVGRNR